MKENVLMKKYNKLGIFLATSIFLFIAIRNIPLYPAVFADEWHYSLLSRIGRISASMDPNYLYLEIFRATNSCGDGFLQCARLINEIFFSIAAFFIYLTSKKYTSQPIALFVAVGTMLSPINVYTAYFMPEATYFCGFWILSWCVLSIDASKHHRYGITCGMLLGVLALVKPHALFILPAIMLVSGYRSAVSRDQPQAGRSFVTAAFVLLSMLVARYGLGYLFAGKAGLSFFGARYADQASQSSEMPRLLHFASLTFLVLARHLLALSLMFGLPLVVAIQMACNSKWYSRAHDNSARPLILYTILILLSLLVVTAAFTVTAVGSGPYETLNRFHSRYYDFVFPLFYIICGAYLNLSAKANAALSSHVTSRWIIVGALAVLSVISMVILRKSVFVSIIDGPELAVFSKYQFAFFLLGLCSIAALFVWSVYGANGVRIYLFVFWPLFLVASIVAGSSSLRANISASIYDRAGLFVRNYLPPNDRRNLLVAGPDLVNLFRSLFYQDNFSASPLLLAAGAPLLPSLIPNDKEWVLLVGDHGSLSGEQIKAPDGTFSLLHLTYIDFSNAELPSSVSSISGFGRPEAIGTWSVDNAASIHFTRPLPKKFLVRFRAKAFGPNAGKRFTAAVSSSVDDFTLGTDPRDIELNMKSDGAQHTLVFTVPEPVSPRSLGMSSDIRRLGVCMSRLQIIPLTSD